MKVWVIDVTNRAAYSGVGTILKVTCQNHFPSNAAAALGDEHVPDVPPHSHARTRGGRREEAAALTRYGVCKNKMAI